MGKRKDGINTITKLRSRCSIRDLTDPDSCWTWKGAGRADSAGAAIWLRVNGKGSVVSAPRAAALLSGMVIPPGGRAWATCKNPFCANPRHAATGTQAEWGAWVRDAGLWVGNQRNIAAAKARGRERSKIDMAIAREIRASQLPIREETRRVHEAHGIEISRTLVSNVRIGKRWAEPNPFAGLGA